MRSDFERFADSGVYTRMRRDDVRWGWYPPLKDPSCERYVSYGSLSTRPARESLSYIRALSEIFKRM